MIVLPTLRGCLTRPAAASVPAITGTATPGQMLTATGGSGAYQWRINGADASGATASTWIVAYAEVIPADSIVCRRGGVDSNALAVTAYDTDAATDIAAVITAGGSTEWGTSAAERNSNKWRYSELIAGLKTDSVYSTGDFYRVLAGPVSLAGILACGRQGAVTNNGPFVSGDLNRLTGLLGNGSTKRLSISTAGNAYGQNDCSLWVYVTAAPTSADAVLRGYAGNTTSGTAGRMLLAKHTTGDAFASCFKNNAANFPSGLVSTATGIIGISRSASTGYTFRANGANQTITQASDGNLANSLSFFARPTANYSDARLAAIGFGAARDLALFDARLATYLANLV